MRRPKWVCRVYMKVVLPPRQRGRLYPRSGMCVVVLCSYWVGLLEREYRGVCNMRSWKLVMAHGCRSANSLARRIHCNGLRADLLQLLKNAIRRASQAFRYGLHQVAARWRLQHEQVRVHPRE